MENLPPVFSAVTRTRADLATLQRRSAVFPFQLGVMLNQKPINGPGIAAKQVEEPWELR